MTQSCSISGCLIEQDDIGYEIRKGICHPMVDEWLTNATLMRLCDKHANEVGLPEIVERIARLSKP